MSRWRRSPNALLGVSRTSARVIPPAAIESADGAVLTVAPDRRKSLSQGVLVEGSILVRLLGLRLLRLEATVVLTPADVGTSTGPRRAVRRPSSASPPRRSAVPRRGLAGAARDIDEGAKLLAQARQGT
jgi:hypothetical protein